jgi:hypothetical protein
MREDQSAQRVVQLYDAILKSRDRVLSQESVIPRLWVRNQSSHHEYLDARVRNTFGYDVKNYVDLRSPNDLKYFRFDLMAATGSEYPSMTEIPWPDNTFDFVFATSVFEHVADQGDSPRVEARRLVSQHLPIEMAPDRGAHQCALGWGLAITPLSQAVHSSRHQGRGPGKIHRRPGPGPQLPIFDAWRQLPSRAPNCGPSPPNLRRVRIRRGRIYQPQSREIEIFGDPAQSPSNFAVPVSLRSYPSHFGTEAEIIYKSLSRNTIDRNVRIVE